MNGPLKKRTSRHVRPRCLVRPRGEVKVEKSVYFSSNFSSTQAKSNLGGAAEHKCPPGPPSLFPACQNTKQHLHVPLPTFRGNIRQHPLATYCAMYTSFFRISLVWLALSAQRNEQYPAHANHACQPACLPSTAPINTITHLTCLSLFLPVG